MLYTLTPAPNVFPGVHRHLSELEQFGTKHIYLDQLDQVTKEDTIIFGAWEPNFYGMAIRRCKAKKKAILWTSPLLQAQMNEPELLYLETILHMKEKKILDYILFADIETYEVFKSDGLFHLPHPCNISKIEKYRKVSPKENCKDIFCFMPWGNKNKNQMVQLAAIKLFQKYNPENMLHTNGMGSWREWAVRLKLNFEDHGYLPTDKYYNNIYNKKCGIHVTLSESFGYCILDAFLLSTPVLCSPAINWAPKEVITHNPDDPIKIAADLKFVYDNYINLGGICRDTALGVVEKYNKKAKEIISLIIQ
jgi:hypothetical protein